MTADIRPLGSEPAAGLHDSGRSGGHGGYRLVAPDRVTAGAVEDDVDRLFGSAGG